MTKGHSSARRFDIRDIAALACAIILVACCFISAKLVSSADETNKGPEIAEIGEVSLKQLDDAADNIQTTGNNQAAITPDDASAESKFDTKTLIVVTTQSETLDSLNAEKTSLGNGRYTLTFQSVEETEQAYELLNNAENTTVVISQKLKLSYSDTYAYEDTGLWIYDSWLNNGSSADTGDIIVTVIDSGIDVNHPVFNNQSRLLLDEYAGDYTGGINSDGTPQSHDVADLNEGGHGTKTASTVALSTPSNVKIRPVRVASGSAATDIDFSAVAKAVTSLAGHSDIINISLGAQKPASITDEEWQRNIELLDTQFFRPTYNAGSLIVAASGNDSASAVDFPANTPSVIAVGAVDVDNIKTDFSNYGPEIEFVMPGERIVVAEKGTDQYVFSNGTSFASPLLAGAAASIKTEKPNLTQAQLRNELRNYTKHLSNPNDSTNYYGNGVISFRTTIFNKPKIYAKLQSNDWVTSDTLRLSIGANDGISGITINDQSLSVDACADYEVCPGSIAVAGNGEITVTATDRHDQTSTATATERFIDLTAPVVSSYKANAILDTSLALNASISDASSGIAHVVILDTTAGDENAVVVSDTPYAASSTPSLEFSQAIDNLSPKTGYKFTILAVDKVGNASHGQKLPVTTLTTEEADAIRGRDDEGGETKPSDIIIDGETSDAPEKPVKAPKTADNFTAYTTGFAAFGAATFLVYYIVSRRR